MKRNTTTGRFTGCVYAIWMYNRGRGQFGISQFALLRFASAADRDGFISREWSRSPYDSYLPVTTRKASRYFDLRHFDDPCGQRYFELNPRITPAPSGRIVFGIETRENMPSERFKELDTMMHEAWLAWAIDED